MMHITLEIYKHIPDVRNGYDTTNGGISSRQDELEVFSEDSTDEEIGEWCERHGKRIEDVARINKRMLWGEKHYYIEPAVGPSNYIGPMFGGNYASTCNSAWADMLGESTMRPLPIHDRFETSEQYAMMSW